MQVPGAGGPCRGKTNPGQKPPVEAAKIGKHTKMNRVLNGVSWCLMVFHGV